MSATMHDDDLRRCYHTLELPPSATLDEVRDAYRMLSRVWHPDRFAGNPELEAKATAHQQALNDAYARLTDAYARGLAPHSAPQGEPAAPAQTAATGRVASAADARTAARAPPTHSRRRLRDRPLFTGTAFLVLGVLVAFAIPIVKMDAPIRTSDGERLRATALAAGGRHVCASAAGIVLCWGANESGQGGRADDRALSEAMPAGVPAGASDIAAGLRHTCALATNGRVYCWGANYTGQLGNRSLDDRREAAAVASDVAFASLSALAYHTCGVTHGGAAYCWGNDIDGQLGAGKPVAQCRWDALSFFCSDRPERVAPAIMWRAIAAGGSHSCGIDAAGSVHCWGSNSGGQLGAITDGECRGPDGTQPCSRHPLPVDGLTEKAVAIAAGASHSCALAETGRVYCWGANSNGQSGAADSAFIRTPAALNTTLRFSAIDAGGHHTCAITRDHALYCWGSDENGELHGEAHARCAGKPCAPQPVRVVRNDVAAAAAGFGSTCIRRLSGEVVCWGRGDAIAAETMRALRTGSDSGQAIDRFMADLRWRFGAVKRFVYRNIVAPLEQP